MENQESEGAHAVSSQVLEYYKKYSQDQKLSTYFRGDASKVNNETDKLSVPSDGIAYEIHNSGFNDATNFSKVKQKSRPPLVGQDNELPDNLGFDDANDGVKVSSPTSSITSNRKLEWDNGADIGYDNCQKHKILHKSLSLPILTTLEQMQLLRLSPEGNATESIQQMTRNTRISSSSDSEKCSTRLESSSSSENINKKVEIDSTSSSYHNPPENITDSESNECNVKSNTVFSLVKKVGLPIAESTPIYVLSGNLNVPFESTPRIQKLKRVQHGKANFIDKSTSVPSDNKSTKSAATNTKSNSDIKDSSNSLSNSTDTSQTKEQQLKYFTRYRCQKRMQLCVTKPLSVECVDYKCICDKDIQTTLSQRVSIGIQTVNVADESLNVNHKENVQYEERQSIVFIKQSDSGSEPSTRSLGTNTNSNGVIASDCNSFEYLYGEQYDNLKSSNSSSHRNQSKISTATYNSCNDSNSVPTNLKRSQVNPDLTALHCDSDETSSKSSPLGNLIASRRSNNLIPDIDKSIDLLQKLLKSKKYDKVTKQYYLDKIVKKILNSTYKSDTSVNSNHEEINLSDYTTQHIDQDQNNSPSSADDVKSSQNNHRILQDNLPWIPATSPNIKSFSNNWMNRKLEVRTFSTEIMPGTSHQQPVNSKLKDPRFTLAKDSIYIGHDLKPTQYASRFESNQSNFNTYPEKFVLPQSSNQSTLETSEAENGCLVETRKFQDWKNDKTLSEKLFEQRHNQNPSDKCHGDGNISSTSDTDIVVNFAKKERQNQLHWVSSEISHLNKLKDLLRKESVEKQNMHVDVLTKPQVEMGDSTKSTSVYVITTETSKSVKNRKYDKYHQNSSHSNSQDSGAYKIYHPSNAVPCNVDTCSYVKSFGKNNVKTAINDSFVIDDNISTELRNAKLISKKMYTQGNPYTCIRRYVFEVPVDCNKAVPKSDYLKIYDADDREKLQYIGELSPQTHSDDHKEKIKYSSSHDAQTETARQNVKQSQTISNGKQISNSAGTQHEINNTFDLYERQKQADSTGQTIKQKPSSETLKPQRSTRTYGDTSGEPLKTYAHKTIETEKSNGLKIKDIPDSLSKTSGHTLKRTDMKIKAADHKIVDDEKKIKKNDAGSGDEVIDYNDKNGFQKTKRKAHKVPHRINNDKTKIQRDKRKNEAISESPVEEREIDEEAPKNTKKPTKVTNNEYTNTASGKKEDQHVDIRNMAKKENKVSDPRHSTNGTNNTNDESKYKAKDERAKKGINDQNTYVQSHQKDDPRAIKSEIVKRNPKMKHQENASDDGSYTDDEEHADKNSVKKSEKVPRKKRSRDPKIKHLENTSDDQSYTDDEGHADKNSAKKSEKAPRKKRSRDPKMKHLENTSDDQSRTDDEEHAHKKRSRSKDPKMKHQENTSDDESRTDDEEHADKNSTKKSENAPQKKRSKGPKMKHQENASDDESCTDDEEHADKNSVKKSEKEARKKRSKNPKMKHQENASDDVTDDDEHGGKNSVTKSEKAPRRKRSKDHKMKHQENASKDGSLTDDEEHADKNSVKKSEKEPWKKRSKDHKIKHQQSTNKDAITDDEQHADGKSGKKSEKAMQQKGFKEKGSESISSSASSSIESSDSSESYSIGICPCCKLNEASIRTKALATSLQNNLQRTLCQPCFVQSQQTNWPHKQPYYTYPGHVCNCLTVVNTATVNEIKRTVNELDRLEKETNHCPCRYSKSKYCTHRNCKYRQKHAKPIAYTLTFEDGDPESEEKVKKNRSLEEITIKIPNRNHRKKRNKDHENRSHKKKHGKENAPNSKEHKHSHKKEKKSKHVTLQDYLYLNRRNFIENAEERRKCMIDLAYLREQRCQKYKQLLAMTNGVTVNNESNEQKKSRMFSSQEMKKITAKNYKKLPEVQKKLHDNKEKQLKTANRLLADIFNKKLQENALKGNLTLSTNASVIQLH